VGTRRGEEHLAGNDGSRQGPRRRWALLEPRWNEPEGVTVIDATARRGWRFDAVVVARNRRRSAGDDARGLRLLYVAMTRPIQHLSIVHAAPLPALLVA